MQAFILERYGGGGAVRLGDMPDPGLRDDDVLVRVRAAGVKAHVEAGRAKGKVVVRMERT